MKECEGYWKDPKGQDPAPTHDFSRTLKIIMGLNYLYNFYFIDYKKNDSKHEVINEWFKPFNKRIKHVKEFTYLVIQLASFFRTFLFNIVKTKNIKR